MRSSTLVLGVALFAAPLALVTAPGNPLGVSLLSQANAQTAGGMAGQTFEPAPVPSVQPPGLSPVDRFNDATVSSINAAGPVNSTPFSGVPSGNIPVSGVSTERADQSLTNGDASAATPNLAR